MEIHVLFHVDFDLQLLKTYLQVQLLQSLKKRKTARTQVCINIKHHLHHHLHRQHHRQHQYRDYENEREHKEDIMELIESTRR